MSNNIRLALSGAVCSLLAQTASAENPHGVGDLDASAAILFYTEGDRVSALEPVINVRKIVDTDEQINIKITLDSLTGASANGAIPTNRIQTFTRPSGEGSYTGRPNETPLDNSFTDTRLALNGSWDKPSWYGSAASYGLNLSAEFDYVSIGASSLYALNSSDANTSYSTGLALAIDRIHPVGGTPLAFSGMRGPEQARQLQSRNQFKAIVDVLAGLSQVIDDKSLVQLNYSLSVANGYQSDPYKVISLVDENSGDVVFANGSMPSVIYENRPELRVKQSLYAQYKRWITGDVIDLSYRFMLDDWGVKSHTVDFGYRVAMDAGYFLRPRIRAYQQSAADFYTPFIIDGQQARAGDESVHASADYRLGEFNAYTAGFEMGRENAQNTWSVVLEYYLQTGDEPDGKFGQMLNQELYPDVSAVMFKLLYDF